MKITKSKAAGIVRFLFPRAKINPKKIIVKHHTLSYTDPTTIRMEIQSREDIQAPATRQDPYDQDKIPAVLCRMATIVNILENHDCLRPIDIKGVRYEITPILHTRHLYFPEHPFARTFGSDSLTGEFFGVKTVMGNGGPEFAIGFELKKSETQEESREDSRMNARALDKEGSDA